MKKENDIIEETFSDIIRERMTETQFWKWVSEWMDAENICDIAENWDLEDKKDLVDRWQAGRIK